jgi:hypothetical protein
MFTSAETRTTRAFAQTAREMTKMGTFPVRRDSTNVNPVRLTNNSLQASPA